MVIVLELGFDLVVVLLLFCFLVLSEIEGKGLNIFYVVREYFIVKYGMQEEEDDGVIEIREVRCFNSQF